MKTARVFVAESHRGMRDGLRALIEGEPELELIGEAGSGAEALESFKVLWPDVVLLDMHLAKVNALEVRAEMLQVKPDACIIALTTLSGDRRAHEARKLGATAAFVKTSCGDELVEIIRVLFATTGGGGEQRPGGRGVLSLDAA